MIVAGVGTAARHRGSGTSAAAEGTPGEAMYMAAQTAYRWNQDMAALYDRLIANGKGHKVAIVAIMRKLIILANVLLRDGRKWAPNAPKSAIPSCG